MGSGERRHVTDVGIQAEEVRPLVGRAQGNPTSERSTVARIYNANASESWIAVRPGTEDFVGSTRHLVGAVDGLIGLLGVQGELGDPDVLPYRGGAAYVVMERLERDVDAEVLPTDVLRHDRGVGGAGRPTVVERHRHRTSGPAATDGWNGRWASPRRSCR
jgi:hypothetical protein